MITGKSGIRANPVVADPACELQEAPSGAQRGRQAGAKGCVVCSSVHQRAKRTGPTIKKQTNPTSQSFGRCPGPHRGDRGRRGSASEEVTEPPRAMCWHGWMSVFLVQPFEHSLPEVQHVMPSGFFSNQGTPLAT